ncbi:Zn(II)2Cys6 transcription factor domain-containing protein [Aspergillus undulatus]|uniref:Zn(II)2Cys6 transcription factor domain-containing protein n=1 Tax=Aspergillus undulatus TaxID=1810928 RepID=UPI003CCD7160
MPSPDRSGLPRLKTRTGCLTCKRVKCDEAKPHCMRCTSTGRKCDGYGSPPGPGARLTNRDLIHRPILMPSGNEREKRSFQFFYERTVPSLAGYCGSNFWNRLVLQVSQHEKAVWHALIALGSLHENFENDRNIPGLWFSRRGQDCFAVQEYLYAIRALLGSSSPGGVWSANLPVGVCLISCILFACFEVLSSHYDSAINHIRGGIKIMNESYYDPRLGTFCHPHLKPSIVTGLEMGTLHKMLILLQDQALVLTRDRIDQQLAHSATFSEPYLNIPEIFSSVAEARDTFEYYRYKADRDFRDNAGTGPSCETTAEFATLLRSYDPLIRKFCTTLHKFEHTRGERLSAREQIGLRILKIHQAMQRIRLEHAQLRRTEQVSWDRFNPVFEEIVNLAAYVVDSTHGVDCLSLSPSQLEQLSNTRHFKPSFTLDMGIIGPVYNVATLCRDPFIRRKAVRVLHSASRQEGCFNSHVCAVIAEQAIAIEETAALRISPDSESVPLLQTLSGLQLQDYQAGRITHCSEVPENARLLFVYPRVDPVEKKVYMRLSQRGVDVDVPLPAMAAMGDMMIS